MIQYIVDLFKIWKEVKPIYKAYKLKDSSLVKALQLSDEVDKLIERYKKASSQADKDAVKKDLETVVAGLHQLMTVTLKPQGVKPKDIPEKMVNVLADLTSAEFARQELHRIYWAMDAGQLPVDDKPTWQRRRRGLVTMQQGYWNLAIQMSGLIRSYQRDIDALQDAESQNRAVYDELKKINDATVPAQLKMLEEDMNEFIQAEREARDYKQHFVNVEAWASKQYTRFTETIKAGDLLAEEQAKK